MASKLGKRRNSGSSDSRDPKKPRRELKLIIHQRSIELEKLKHELEVKTQKIEAQDSEIDLLKKKIADLEEEVTRLKQELSESQDELKEIGETVSRLQGNQNVLIMGEVCSLFQANLHQVVFQEEKVSKYFRYKMADLDREIEDIASKEERGEARKLWEDLKQKDHPERFQELVKKLQKMRNATAHPEITGKMGIEDVLKAAKELNEQGEFGFLKPRFKFKDIKEFIELWDRTEHYVKGLKK